MSPAASIPTITQIAASQPFALLQSPDQQSQPGLK
jgi:hypothetical protein